MSNKLNTSRSLEGVSDVTRSYLCSSNLSIYKLLPRLSRKPFRQNLYSSCSAFQWCTRGLFNQWWVWAASLTLMWCLCYRKPAVGNLVQHWFHSGHAKSLATTSGLHKISTAGVQATWDGKSEQAQFHSPCAVQHCPKDCCSSSPLSAAYSTLQHLESWGNHFVNTTAKDVWEGGSFSPS